MAKKKKKTISEVSFTAAAKEKRVTRADDKTLTWVERDYPQLSVWRVLAVE